MREKFYIYIEKSKNQNKYYYGKTRSIDIKKLKKNHKYMSYN